MKLRFLSVFSVTLLIISVLVFSFKSAPVSNVSKNSGINAVGDVITIANNSKKGADSVKVLETRILNLLNHNFVYGDDFCDIEAIVNQSVIALLDSRSENDESFISESIVKNYIFDMYGIEINDFSEINKDFPQKEGYVYIIPRGYSVYEHEMVSVSLNEDGSYSVKTKITVSSHDGVEHTDFCESLIIENEKSALGFSIISSDIGSESLPL